MIYSSLAVLALSASAAVNPFTNLVHLHPKQAQTDTRVTVSLYNKGPMFCDVKIDGHTYTMRSKGLLSIKAPAGTVIYADSRTMDHKRGDTILDITPNLNNQQVVID
jgi:hypothetical protein